MSGRIWIPQPSEAPTPVEVAAYLQQKGWKPLGTKPNWAEYSRDEDGEEIHLEIPLRVTAANRLRAEAIYPASELYGTVVKLDSEDPSAGGEAVVRAAWEGRMRKIRVPLSAADYPVAIQAHADRNLVRCTGDLERDGAVWVLRYARDFSILSDPDDLAL